jgi:thymidylate synthase
MMVASHLGYQPGVFTHYVQNLHIYSKHMQFVENLLNTTPLDVQPKIELINHRDFYDFTINDFKITGIDNIPKLGKLELAI